MEEEDLIQDIVVFKDIKGTFGNFRTNNSFEIYYLMTSVNISDINVLKEASAVLKLNKINFDAIVQRDIDYQRVSEIFNDYLDKSNERVVFFPPLLATLMITENGEPVAKYQDVQSEIVMIGEREYLKKSWDDKIKLSLPLSKNETGFIIDINSDLKKNYIHYAATIGYLENRVDLVVIDGQHRLKALKELREKYPEMKSINVPLCIFFSSNASNSNDEDIIKDMRELFVTINNKARKVSGHFITLLKDKSLSSIAVRELANNWKGTTEDYSDCKLFFMEWNQRNDGRAFQVGRKFSITTVSIIADALAKYVFHPKNGLTKSILNLEEVQEELSCGLHYTEISEGEFNLCQTDILILQINKYIVPSLNILLLESKPYLSIQKSFNIAFGKHKQKVDQKKDGARDYLENILYEFRDLNKLDSDTRRAYNSEFLADIDCSEFDGYFTNNIFQQAYIWSWFWLYQNLEGVSPVDVAKAISSSFEYIVFNAQKNLFDPRRDYTQQVLYRGQRMLVNEGVKENIADMIISTLLNKEARKIFCSKISDGGKFEDKILQLSTNCLDNYFEDFLRKNIGYLKQNYTFDVSVTAEKKKELAALEIAKEKEHFELEINNIVKVRLVSAKEIFMNLLV